MDSQSLQSLEFDRILHTLAVCAVTPQGKRLALALTPTTDADLLTQRQTYLRQFIVILASDGECPLGGLEDIADLLHKTHPAHAILLPGELRVITGNIRIAGMVRSFFRNRAARAPDLATHAARLTPRLEIADAVAAAIDDADHVVDHASTELSRIRRAIVHSEESLRKRLTTLMRSLAKAGYSQEGDILSIKNGRAVVAVKDVYRHRVPGVVHHVSSSGATVFVEPLDVLELNNHLDRLRAEEEREIVRILAGLTNQIRSAATELETNDRLLGELDVVYAAARFAHRVGGVVPRVAPGLPVHLENARHPLLLLKDHAAPVVPLSLTLRPGAATLVMTGPNAGGKTVALKTVGLLGVMAHAGLAIPADATSTYPLLSHIFCDIGDQQSLDDDLSTFSSRILRYRTLALEANDTTLALLDEIAEGTDPEEGGAIAMALLEHLTAVGAAVVVTTHHSGLKVFAQNTPGVMNGSMSFDTDRLAPTFHFQPGIPGSSFALEISERMQMPAPLLARARELFGAKQQALDTLLRELERKLIQARTDADVAEKARCTAESMRAEYHEKLKQLEKEYRQESRKRIAETERSLKDANRRVEQAIREIRSTQASDASMRQAREAAAHARDALTQAHDATAEDPGGGLRPGSTIMVPMLQKTGVVESIRPVAGKARIRIGGKRIEVDIADLGLSAADNPIPVRRAVDRFPDAPVPDSLDLRGQNALDARDGTDAYLVSAANAGLVKVTIIHGFGTGVLRDAVREICTGHPLVAAMRPGRHGEGGGGVTIVELH